MNIVLVLTSYVFDDTTEQITVGVAAFDADTQDIYQLDKSGNKIEHSLSNGETVYATLPPNQLPQPLYTATVVDPGLNPPEQVLADVRAAADQARKDIERTHLAAVVTGFVGVGVPLVPALKPLPPGA